MDRQMWAITIDFWRSRGWQWGVLFLLPMALPLLMYAPFYVHLKYYWQHDPSAVMMHVVLTGIIALGIVGKLLTWLNSLGREYTLPITTWKLVLTHSVEGALVSAASYTLACLMVNWLFEVPWPFLGPVLLLIAIYLAAQALHWLTMKSQILELLVFAPFCLLAAWWFGLCYEAGGLSGGNGQRLQMWTHVTWSEWGTLLLVGAGGVWGSYYAARLQRMGSGPTLAGLIAALFGESPRSARAALPAFTNYQSAQRWREWRDRGRAIPILFAVAAIFYGGLWWLLPLNAQDAVKMGAGFSTMGAMSFWLWGNYLGMRSKRQTFPSFDATRPITDAQWARALLRNMARNTLTACGVWVLGVSLVGAIAWGLGVEHLEAALGNSLGGEFAHPKLTDLYDLIVFFGELAALSCFWVLVCWTFSANGMMLALLRRRATIGLVAGSMTLFIVTMLGTVLWVPEHLQDNVVRSFWGAVFTVLLVATLGSFVVAWRRKLIGRSICLYCLTAWLAFVSGVLYWLAIKLPPVSERLFIGFVLSSLLMLPFLPIAGTPLAVAWNRHR